MDSNGEKVCPICKGLGYIITERGAKKCKCIYESFDLSKFLNIPTRFKEANIAKLKNRLNREVIASIYAYLKNFKDYAKEGLGLLFVGPPGVGKTYTAVAVLKFLYKRYKVKGHFTDTKELSIKLREMFASGEHLRFVDTLSKIPVLVLDDLGNELLTDWYKDILLGIINKRYNEKKVTIITTNYYPSYLLVANKTTPGRGIKIVDKKNTSDISTKELTLDSRYGSHIVSRLGEMTHPIVLSGSDKRIAKVVI